MIALDHHERGQELRIVQRPPPAHEGLRSQDAQGVVPGLYPAEVRFPAPDGHNDLPRHPIALLDAVQNRLPLIQKATPRLRESGDLSFGKIAARTLEFCLALIA
jgi:hypothetical protein